MNALYHYDNGGDHMDQPAPQNEPDVYLSIEPISGKVHAVFESGFFLKFDDLSALREYCCTLLAEANRLENHLASMGTSKRKTPEVPKRYAKKAIKEWELEIELLAADPANDKNRGKDHEDNLNG
jgi:hypothetical protein